MRTNLNDLASELATQEGLDDKIGVANVKEVLALLGLRWRGMNTEDAIREIACIMNRAGLLSRHKSRHPEQTYAELDEGISDINREGTG